MLWTRFLFRLSLYFGALSFSSTLTSSSNQRILFLTVWGSFRCFFTNSKCVFMRLHWRDYWVLHTAIKPRSMECCSDVCPSVDVSYLHIWSWSSTRVNIGFLVTTLTKSPSPSVAQFGQEASSKKNPDCFQRLPLRVTETTCFCGSSLDMWLDANLFLSSTCSYFDLRSWILLWYALSAVRSFMKMCAFPNHTHSIEFATG